MRSNLRTLTYLLLFNFVLIIFTMTYWQVVKKDEIYLHPRNKRLSAMEERTLRGSILDRNGTELAISDKEKGRHFPFADVAAHLVGYNSKKYGMAGLEYTLNAELLGFTGRAEVLPFLPELKQQRYGHHVTTTIDIQLQQLAYRLLGNNRGAVAIVKPKTGEILTLVTKPSYDPNKIEDNWQELQREGNGSPLLNRSTQGLYPPGSTLKVVTGVGALQQNSDNWERIFNAPGYIVVRGNRIEDERVVGKIGFVEAMQRSSNYVFATLGVEMGDQAFSENLVTFGLTEKLELGIPSSRPKVALTEELVPEALAETAIGQGKTLITPLHMALVAAAIGNEGQMPKPYLVKESRNVQGRIVSEEQEPQYTTVTSPDISEKIKKAMVAVVERGTGKSVSIQGLQVAGKTGSAENPHGETHAWFIGFAPADSPEVALAVIVENGGAGGAVAGPIARALFESAINNKR